jgi:hypothetical protein
VHQSLFTLLAPVLAALTSPSLATKGIFSPSLRHKTEAILSKTGQRWQINLVDEAASESTFCGDLRVPQDGPVQEQSALHALIWFQSTL